MPRQPKPRPVGRPKLAKGEAKAKIVPVRLNPDHHKKFLAAARNSGQNLSDWIRNTLLANIETVEG
jgi:predicted HicB family RNase H-like nuclease